MKPTLRHSALLACNHTITSLPKDGIHYGLSGVSCLSVRYLLALCLGLVVLVGLTGNLLMILVLADSFRGSKSNIAAITSTLMINISVFDMIFLLYDVPVMLLTFLFEDWRLGATICISSQSLSTWAMCSGFYTMVATSVLRYLAVVHPARSSSTCCHRLLLLSLTWILGFVVSIPSWMHQQVISLESRFYCVLCMTELQTVLYFALFAGVAFLPAMLLMVLCYWEIVRFLWCRRGGVIRAENCHRKSRQVTAKIITIVMVFVVMWMPYWVVTFLLVNRSLPQNPVVYVVSSLSILLAYSNCCVSPLIFFGFSDQTRLQLKNLFRGHYRANAGRSHAYRAEIAVCTTAPNFYRLSLETEIS
ncbi:galanin receptor 2a [Alligator mississippiensis]|uniref:galanin receptor 2a n=1 Tax=Alligator mississippiensis TaxID=8496 RepID=UPI0028772D39|nr:galanin receptor 2a [Alligator mississippiensis]